MAFDYRKARPYSGYENYDFEVPTATEGDTYARYLVRLEEMRQSLRIIDQALKNLPDGPVWTADRKMALPPRQELDTSMEALIHHFKLITEGFVAPVGEVYECVENHRGELGFYLVSDGTAIPYRLHVRTPSFVNLQATDTMVRGAWSQIWCSSSGRSTLCWVMLTGNEGSWKQVKGREHRMKQHSDRYLTLRSSSPLLSVSGGMSAF